MTFSRWSLKSRQRVGIEHWEPPSSSETEMPAKGTKKVGKNPKGLVSQGAKEETAGSDRWRHVLGDKVFPLSERCPWAFVPAHRREPAALAVSAAVAQLVPCRLMEGTPCEGWIKKQRTLKTKN